MLCAVWFAVTLIATEPCVRICVDFAFLVLLCLLANDRNVSCRQNNVKNDECNNIAGLSRTK